MRIAGCESRYQGVGCEKGFKKTLRERSFEGEVIGGNPGCASWGCHRGCAGSTSVVAQGMMLKVAVT